MVSLSPPTIQLRIDQVVRSSDLAIRQLLTEDTDRFSLAMYLWVVRSHELTLVNGGLLAAWAEHWIDRVLLRNEIGRRADEEITAAALAAAALAGSRSRIDVVELKGAVQHWLVAELAAQSIPFRSPGYAAVLLFAASVLGVDEAHLDRAAKAVIQSFEAALPAGPSFGIGFAIAILRRVDNGPEFAALEARLRQALTDPRLEYENALYLLQSLWTLQGSGPEHEEILTLTERVVTRSPVWSYLMTGVEDVEPAGDGHIVMPISHLYRAELLDVLLRLQQLAQMRAEAQFNARYRGRTMIDVFASIGVLAVILGVWVVLVWQLDSTHDASTQFWLHHDYNAMTPLRALLVLGSALGVVHLAMFTPVAVWTLWCLMIRSAVESDRRITEVLSRRAWRTVKLWAAVVLLPIIGLAFNVLVEPLQHILTSG